jgi:hypothetical protein
MSRHRKIVLVNHRHKPLNLIYLGDCCEHSTGKDIEGSGRDLIQGVSQKCPGVAEENPTKLNLVSWYPDPYSAQAPYRSDLPAQSKAFYFT